MLSSRPWARVIHRHRRPPPRQVDALNHPRSNDSEEPSGLASGGHRPRLPLEPVGGNTLSDASGLWNRRRRETRRATPGRAESPSPSRNVPIPAQIHAAPNPDSTHSPGEDVASDFLASPQRPDGSLPRPSLESLPRGCRFRQVDRFDISHGPRESSPTMAGATDCSHPVRDRRPAATD